MFVPFLESEWSTNRRRSTILVGANSTKMSFGRETPNLKSEIRNQRQTRNSPASNPTMTNPRGMAPSETGLRISNMKPEMLRTP